MDRILEHLVKVTRQNAGRAENPTCAIIDSQSVKTTYATDQRGFDRKKTKGRKQHIATDTIGCMLNVTVHKANEHDTKIGWWIARLALFTYPTIEQFCADRGYRGTFIHNENAILNRGVDVSEKIKSQVWHIEPKRWVVEKTFAWLNNSRRLCKDYEILTSSSESMIKISHIHTLLKRL